MINFPRSEPEFSQFLVREYFRLGSVDEVLKHYKFSLPVSYATYQRILDKYGVIKKASSSGRLSEAIDFFEHLIKSNINLDELYRKTPHSFRTSLKTLYRIYSYMKEGLTRRVGVVLIISPYDNPEKILLGRDFSTPSLELGKNRGAWSLPMGFTRKRDSRRNGVLGVLQNEVFTSMVFMGNFPYFFIPDVLEPFMYLDIADVRVAAYNLILPKSLSKVGCFSSYKLRYYKFLDIEEVFRLEDVRMGVVDIVRGYKKYLKCLKKGMVVNPFQSVSLLNQEIIEFAFEFER